MKRYPKLYPLHDCLLYKLSNKKRLASIINTDIKNFDLLRENDLYKVHTYAGRVIQEPVQELRRVHNRLFTLISRIETPRFLFSGKKGCSHVSNARAHVENHYFTKMDIEGFYRNSLKEYVFRFYLHILRQAPDIARILAEISCYKEIIPTGSPLSQQLAYWAYEKMFREVYQFTEQLTFSLYVDDLTFSSILPISQTLHLDIQKLMKKYRHKLKRKKIEYFGKKDFKCITGCIITPENRLVAPNRQRHKVIKLINKFNSFAEIPEHLKLKLYGWISSSQQIEGKIFKDTKIHLINI